MSITTIVILILSFLVAITIHEAAHAWMSDKLGDPTARLMGRLTLNPIAHLDPYGTVLFPLILIFIGSPFIFGWAKPVSFDPYNLKNPRKDAALISLAGPASNLILAIILSVFLGLGIVAVNPLSFTYILLVSVIRLNVVLALFNLIPIHPLDGGKIFVGLLPEKDAHEADIFLKRYGMIILLFLIFPTIRGTSPLFLVLTPVLNFVLGILIPGTPFL